ncbi:histidinol-phosphate transaminase [Cyanobacterium aponinum UTEX 3221]|uniref:histidinol-phosphate transaminase n=1 Tax=Cyanobacterium aponinum TaxID=379064 RepID=UPI002B4BC41D|nr:histidinol-phosphate transaminase [Cyanobacterium aponinum]WRL38713.1 histidinol-phosphate transaminase [Cyanobacterium aponinum UTEX 3221]
MTDFIPSFIREDLLKLSAYIPTPISDNQKQLTRLDANESPYNLPSELRIKLASFYEQEIETNRYPDGSHSVLKKLIVNYVNESINKEGLFNVNNISIGNGSDELIRSILMATCLNNQGSILVANPTFSMYKILAESLGINTISIERNEIDFSWDIDKANQAIRETNNPPIKVIFVVHPNSPTANCLNDSEIAWLKNLPSDILVVIDEAYYEFSKKTLAIELKNYPNWLVLRTFSKAFRLAAHRVGYAIASPAIINVLEKLRLPYNLPTFSQLAAQFAMENSQLILPAVEETIKEKERVFQELNKIKNLKIWRSDANFIYCRLKENGNDENHQNILNQLKEKNILIRHTGGGLRISIGTPEENDYLLSTIQSLFNQ